ncbi:HlyD family efflux transporter periplasmic adaptor subunit [Parvibaculum sp.]|uniref:HlyD family secretion protein n=1 Tax=Parvibaculum sp. TaxID=2024848 RepID=UPI00320F0383
MRMRMLGLVAAIVAVAIVAAGYGWWRWSHPGLPDGVTQTNGRIEAEQVQVAAKTPGRVMEVLAEEGDFVKAGAVLARMDTRDTKAQLLQAQAQLLAAQRTKEEAVAAVAQREAQRTLYRRQYGRTARLNKSGYASNDQLDQARAQRDAGDAAYDAAVASVSQADAAIEAAKATVQQIETVLEDAVLVAPRSGRVQYKLIQPGEVVGAGTPILTLLDVSDVYMTVFLPAKVAGGVRIGDEARLVLDPAPQYVIPANVTFVAADAQFTPKSVETADEREKLMFRIKLNIDRDLLARYATVVKTGVRGMAYVRYRSGVEWPATLAVKLPDEPR